MNPLFSSARRSAASSLCAPPSIPRPPYQPDSRVNVKWLDSRSGEIASEFQPVRSSGLVLDILFTLLCQRIVLDLSRDILPPLRIRNAGLLPFGEGHHLSEETSLYRPSISQESVRRRIVNHPGERDFEHSRIFARKLTSKLKDRDASDSACSGALDDNLPQPVDNVKPRESPFSNSYKRSYKSRDVTCRHSILTPSTRDSALTDKLKRLHNETSKVRPQNHETRQYTKFKGAPSPTPQQISVPYKSSEPTLSCVS
jgi:hypothetical protein